MVHIYSFLIPSIKKTTQSQLDQDPDSNECNLDMLPVPRSAMWPSFIIEEEVKFPTEQENTDYRSVYTYNYFPCT